MNDDIKIRIHVTKGTLVLAELHSAIDDGRHEFVFAQPIAYNGRHFGGFAVECWLDREPRHITYKRHPHEHDEVPALAPPALIR